MLLVTRLDKVGRSDELHRNTGKGTPVTAELVGNAHGQATQA